MSEVACDVSDAASAEAALAAAANRLRCEPGLRDRLAAAAAARAVAEFDHRVMAQRSLEIYRRVLTGVTGTSSCRDGERGDPRILSTPLIS